MNMMNFHRDNRRESGQWVPIIGALLIVLVCIFIAPIFSPSIQRFDQRLARTEDLFTKDTLPPQAATGSIAYVTSRPPQTLYDVFVLDRGSNDGVIVGARVMAEENVALGEIIDVTETTSRFVAYSSPDNRTMGYHTTSKTTLELIGRGGGSYEVRVPRELPIAVGDMITDQSRSQNLLGKVEYIDEDERDPFKIMYIRVPVSWNKLRHVFIQS